MVFLAGEGGIYLCDSCAGDKSTQTQYESECTHLPCVSLPVVKELTDGNGSCSTGKLALKSEEICLFLVGVTDTSWQLQQWAASIWSSAEGEGSLTLTDATSASACLLSVSLGQLCVLLLQSLLSCLLDLISYFCAFSTGVFTWQNLTNNSSSLNIFLQAFFFPLPPPSHPFCPLFCHFLLCFCLVSSSTIFFWHVFPSSVISTLIASCILSKSGTWNFSDCLKADNQLRNFWFQWLNLPKLK